jgi:hypothetical protein
MPGATAVNEHNLSQYNDEKDVLESYQPGPKICGVGPSPPRCGPRRSIRDTEVFRKLTTVLPIAILLSAVSAAPALARTSSHHAVQPLRPVMAVSPYAYGSDAFNSYAIQPIQGGHRALGETPALPFTQDPESAR